MTALLIVLSAFAGSMLVGLVVGWVIRHHPPTDDYRATQARMWGPDQQFDAMCDQARRDKDDAA